MREPEADYLYHFTCDHGAQGIRERGMVLPVALLVPEERLLDIEPDMLWICGFSWWTNLADPESPMLGLQGIHLLCDRMTNRFRAKIPPGYAQWWPLVLRELNLSTARQLSLAPGARPASWWVCKGPVRVEEA